MYVEDAGEMLFRFDAAVESYLHSYGDLSSVGAVGECLPTIFDGGQGHAWEERLLALARLHCSSSISEAARRAVRSFVNRQKVQLPQVQARDSRLQPLVCKLLAETMVFSLIFRQTSPRAMFSSKRSKRTLITCMATVLCVRESVEMFLQYLIASLRTNEDSVEVDGLCHTVRLTADFVREAVEDPTAWVQYWIGRLRGYACMRKGDVALFRPRRLAQMDKATCQGVLSEIVRQGLVVHSHPCCPCSELLDRCYTVADTVEFGRVKSPSPPLPVLVAAHYIGGHGGDRSECPNLATRGLESVVREPGREAICLASLLGVPIERQNERVLVDSQTVKLTPQVDLVRWSVLAFWEAITEEQLDENGAATRSMKPPDPACIPFALLLQQTMLYVVLPQVEWQEIEGWLGIPANRFLSEVLHLLLYRLHKAFRTSEDQIYVQLSVVGLVKLIGALSSLKGRSRIPHYCKNILSQLLISFTPNTQTAACTPVLKRLKRSPMTPRTFHRSGDCELSQLTQGCTERSSQLDLLGLLARSPHRHPTPKPQIVKSNLLTLVERSPRHCSIPLASPKRSSGQSDLMSLVGRSPGPRRLADGSQASRKEGVEDYPTMLVPWQVPLDRNMSLSRFLTPDLLEVSNEWNAGVSNEFAKLSDGAQEVYLPLVLHLTKESLALVSMDALPTAVGQLTGRLSTWPGGSLITCRVVETLIEALIDRPISEPPHVDCLVSCVRMTLFILQDAAGDTWVRDLPSVIALVSQAFSLARLARAFSSLFLRITASGMTDDGLYAIVEQVADLIKGAFDGMMYALRNPQLLRLHPQWFARVRSASTRWQLELDRSVDSMQSLRRRRAKKRCVVPEVIGRQPSQPRITEVSAVHESDSESSGELGDGEFGWVTGDHQEEFANVAGTGSEGLMSSNLQPHWAAFINSLFGSQ